LAQQDDRKTAKSSSSPGFEPILRDDPARSSKQAGVQLTKKLIEEAEVWSKEKGLADLEMPVGLSC